MTLMNRKTPALTIFYVNLLYMNVKYRVFHPHKPIQGLFFNPTVHSLGALVRSYPFSFLYSFIFIIIIIIIIITIIIIVVIIIIFIIIVVVIIIIIIIICSITLEWLYRFGC